MARADCSQRLRTVDQQRDAIAGDERRVGALAECVDQLADVLGLVEIVEPLIDDAFARTRRQHPFAGHDRRLDALGGRRSEGQCGRRCA